MLKHPVMAKVFDVIEALRAVPNGRTPFNDEIKIEKDVVYKSIDGEDIVMDIYYPSCKVADKRPAVIDIPGGGWMIHNRTRRDGYARCFAELGAVVFVIEHRLCPATFFPEDLKDCVDAYNFVVNNAEKYGIDPNNICLTGDSSGGHLTMCMGCASTSEEYTKKLGLHKMRTKPASIITISGAFDFEVMYRIPFTHTLMVRYVSGQKNRRAFRRWEHYKEINIYNYLNKDFPPCHNNGGMMDVLCFGEAKRITKKLNAIGVENECVVGHNLFNSGHCYVLRFPFAPARRDALKLYGWYAKKQKDLGVDMSAEYERLQEFFTKYHKSLKDFKQYMKAKVEKLTKQKAEE